MDFLTPIEKLIYLVTNRYRFDFQTEHKEIRVTACINFWIVTLMSYGSILMMNNSFKASLRMEKELKEENDGIGRSKWQ